MCGFNNGFEPITACVSAGAIRLEQAIEKTPKKKEKTQGQKMGNQGGREGGPTGGMSLFRFCSPRFEEGGRQTQSRALRQSHIGNKSVLVALVHSTGALLAGTSS